LVQCGTVASVFRRERDRYSSIVLGCTESNGSTSSATNRINSNMTDSTPAEVEADYGHKSQPDAA